MSADNEAEVAYWAEVYTEAAAPEPAATRPATAGGTGVSSSTVVRLADVRPEHVDWLWPARLPLGKIVVLDGDPSVGKSTVSVDCAARVSTGRAWPDGSSSRVADVLLLSAEDGLADTIRPRLDAAGGDPARVHALTEIRYADDAGVTRTRPPTLADIDAIEATVRRVLARLVIIDVLMAYLPGKVDSHRDQDIRSVLSGVAAMAERTGSCVLLLRHLNKTAGGSALYRGGGSIGIIGAARVGLLAAVDPDDDTRRVLAATKNNLAQMPDALGYQLVDSPGHGCAQVAWLGATNHTAQGLLSVPLDPEDRSDRDYAVEWLLAHLNNDPYEFPSAGVKKAARAEGISERTLQRARVRANVGHYSTATTPRQTMWTHPDMAVVPSPSDAEDDGMTGMTGTTQQTSGVQPPDDGQMTPVVPSPCAGTTGTNAPVEPGCAECRRRSAFGSGPCPEHTSVQVPA